MRPWPASAKPDAQDVPGSGSLPLGRVPLPWRRTVCHRVSGKRPTGSKSAATLAMTALEIPVPWVTGYLTAGAASPVVVQGRRERGGENRRAPDR